MRWEEPWCCDAHSQAVSAGGAKAAAICSQSPSTLCSDLRTGCRAEYTEGVDSLLWSTSQDSAQSNISSTEAALRPSHVRRYLKCRTRQSIASTTNCARDGVNHPTLVRGRFPIPIRGWLRHCLAGLDIAAVLCGTA